MRRGKRQRSGYLRTKRLRIPAFRRDSASGNTHDALDFLGVLSQALPCRLYPGVGRFDLRRKAATSARGVTAGNMQCMFASICRIDHWRGRRWRANTNQGRYRIRSFFVRALVEHPGVRDQGAGGVIPDRQQRAVFRSSRWWN